MPKWLKRWLLEYRLRDVQSVIDAEQRAIKASQENLDRAMVQSHRLRGQLYWLEHGKIGRA